jgi:ubiquinone/menaquinone biosynthesis C-methylase UbiE
MGRTEEETQRLIVQARLYGESTRRLFEQAGIGPGMKVLDLGSGAGDVAFLAAELVETTGCVVGIDQNPTVLETARQRAVTAGLANVLFVEGDIGAAPLVHDVDAIVGRLVLTYVPDPAAVLRTLVAYLKPGGVVAFAEPDFRLLRDYGAACSGSQVLQQVYTWVLEVFERTGANARMGPDLFRLYRAAGLVDIQMVVHAPLGGAADWAGYNIVVEGVRSILPLLDHYGIATAEQVGLETLGQRLRAEVEETGAPAMLVPHVCAWARKP